MRFCCDPLFSGISLCSPAGAVALRVHELSILDRVSVNSILAVELGVADLNFAFAVRTFAVLLVEFLQLNLSPSHGLSAFEVDELLIDLSTIRE